MANWFYTDANGQKQGPIDNAQFGALVKQGVVTRETVVENEQGKFAPAGRVKGLEFPETKQPEIVQPAVEAEIYGLSSPAPLPPAAPSPFTAPVTPSTPSEASSSKISWETTKQNGMDFLRWVLPILKKGGAKAMEAAKKGGEMAVEASKKAAPHVKAQLDKIPVESLKEKAIQQIDKLPGGRKRIAVIAGAALLVLIGGALMMSGDSKPSASTQNANNAPSLNLPKVQKKPVIDPQAEIDKFCATNAAPKGVAKDADTSAKVPLEDIMLSEILGKESNHYLAHGFANVSFGPQTDLDPDDMVSHRYVNSRQRAVESTTLYRKTSGGGMDIANGYDFDKKKNLVGYTRWYRQYTDTLPSVEDIRENFGRTNQDIRTVGSGKIIRYTFPHVCVVVTIKDKIKEPSVTISVIDREFFERQIRLAIRDRYDAIKWSASVVGSICGIDGGFDNEVALKQYMGRLPKWSYNNVAPINVVRDSVNWIIYAENGEESIHTTNMSYDSRNTYFGKVWSNNLYKTDLASGKRVVGGKETCLEVDIDLCPRIKKDEFFNQTSLFNPLSDTLFSLVHPEINLLLCQEFFPPPDGKYTRHTPSGGDTSMERCTWVTEDGLDVCVFMSPTIDKDRIRISWK